VVNLTETNTTLESKSFVPFSMALGFHPRTWRTCKNVTLGNNAPPILHAFSLCLVASFSTVQMIAFVSKEKS